jgi:hypothetical protein
MSFQNSLYLRMHWLFLCLIFICALAWAIPVLSQARFNYSEDREEVSDTVTGLTWRRCSEGQKLSLGVSQDKDYCIINTEKPISYTHEQALLVAKDEAGWRVPNIKELSSLVDIRRTQPTIDLTAFPTTSNQGYWSSTPLVVDSSFAWLVDFNNGHVLSLSRDNYFHVRLVRNAP